MSNTYTERLEVNDGPYKIRMDLEVERGKGIVRRVRDFIKNDVVQLHQELSPDGCNSNATNHVATVWMIEQGRDLLVWATLSVQMFRLIAEEHDNIVNRAVAHTERSPSND